MAAVNFRIVLIGLAAACAEAARSAADRRPNILWLTAEDIGPNLGCFGDTYAVTPALDRLAEEGVRYTRCFGIAGVCAPNRSCLITGVYPWRLGSQGMRTVTWLPPEVVCFTELLRRAGYYCVNNAKTDYNFPVPKEAWDECGPTAHWTNAPPGRPFFAVFNYEVCHEGQIRATPERRAANTARLTPAHRRDPDTAPVPPYHPDVPEVRQDWARYYENITAMDYQIGDRLRELEWCGAAGNTIVFFFSDNGPGMPGVKQWVWNDGLHVPLIVRVPESWRALAPAAPGEALDRLVSFVDFAPTMLSLAGVDIPPWMQGMAFLGPRAGPPREYVYAGRDRMAERFDCVRVVRDGRYQYLRNFMPQLPWSQVVSYTEAMPTMRAWRALAEFGRLSGPAARYFEPVKPPEELYDCEADPRNVNNLASSPEHRETLARLRGRCEGWMRETGDLGLLPEGEMFRRAAGRSPWAIGVDARLNPLPELLEASRLAAVAGPADVPALVQLLQHPDAAVRWWGVVGLWRLRREAAPAAGFLRRALRDSCPELRLAAADACCEIGRMEEAVPFVQSALAHPEALVRLAALNVVDRMGPVGQRLMQAVSGARRPGQTPVEEYVNRLANDLLKRWSEP